MGFGDVSVNKKMKDFNKILYDILLKIDKSDKKEFTINKKLIFKYFKELDKSNDTIYLVFVRYFKNFYSFCFEISLENMIRKAVKFKNYGSS